MLFIKLQAGRKKYQAQRTKELGIGKEQFAKPFYQKTTWKKIYPNRGEYFGVLRIRVRRSLNLLRKMRGWLAGMADGRI